MPLPLLQSIGNVQYTVGFFLLWKAVSVLTLVGGKQPQVVWQDVVFKGVREAEKIEKRKPMKKVSSTFEYFFYMRGTSAMVSGWWEQRLQAGSRAAFL